MMSRRCAVVFGAFLFLAVLSVLPAAAQSGPTAPASCAALPWEQAAVPVSSGPVSNPVDKDLAKAIFNTSCTSSSQCQTGEVCQCSMCHTACPTGYRWNCICQTCYKCPSGTFFDSSMCGCAAI